VPAMVYVLFMRKTCLGVQFPKIADRTAPHPKEQF